MKKLNVFKITNFLVLLSFTILLLGCKKESQNEQTNNRLEGDWEVESWTIDGVEQMNFSINSFEMEFNPETEEGGETEWTLIDITGSTNKLEGDYVIKNDGREIDFDGEEFDLDLDGDDLEITGNVDGERWEIEAERD